MELRETLKRLMYRDFKPKVRHNKFTKLDSGKPQTQKNAKKNGKITYERP
jgi:hypothetical protein